MGQDKNLVVKRHFLPLILIFLLSLSDFYLGTPGSGIRVFDFFSIPIALFIILWAFIDKTNLAEWQSNTPPSAWLIILISFLYCVVSLILDPNQFGSIIGFSLCLCVFAFWIKIDINEKEFIRILKIIILIHICAVWIQLAFFYGFNIVLNPLAIVGLEARVMAGVFRPAGLFIEPAHFSVTLFTLLILRHRFIDKADLIFWLSLATLAASFSGWGGAAIIALLFFQFKKNIFAWAVISITAIYIAANWDFMSAQFEDIYVIDRLINIETDKSVNTRFGTLDRAFEEIATNPMVWFGRGPNAYNYIYLGNNSIGYMLGMWGIIGSLLIYFLAMSVCPKENRLRATFGIGFSLLATPLWTTFYWWTFLAILIKPMEEKV